MNVDFVMNYHPVHGQQVGSFSLFNWVTLNCSLIEQLTEKISTILLCNSCFRYTISYILFHIYYFRYAVSDVHILLRDRNINNMQCSFAPTFFIIQKKWSIKLVFLPFPLRYTPYTFVIVLSYFICITTYRNNDLKRSF